MVLMERETQIHLGQTEAKVLVAFIEHKNTSPIPLPPSLREIGKMINGPRSNAPLGGSLTKHYVDSLVEKGLLMRYGNKGEARRVVLAENIDYHKIWIDEH